MTDKFFLLAQLSSDWWWEMDAELRFTSFSDQFTKVFGFQPSVVIGKRRDELARSDYGNPAWTKHLDDLAHRRPFKAFETTFVDASGVSRPVEISGTPLFSSDGQFDGYIGTGRDLTENRQRERDVAERSIQLGSILENIEQGVVLFDKEFKVAAYNGRLREILQVDPGWEPRGQTLEEVLHYLADRKEYHLEESKAAIELRVSLIRSGKPFAGERQRSDGRIMSVRFSPVPDGGGVMTYSDVTEMRRREMRLQNLATLLEQEKSRLVTAQQVAKVGSWETNLATLDVIWSAETFRIFGLDPADFSPTHAGFLAFVHPDDRAAVDAAFQASFGTRDVSTVEHRILVPGGGLKYVTERWQTFVDEDGAPLRAVGTCQDFTDLKLAEMTAAEASNLLAVAGRTARLGGWTAHVDEGRVEWSAVTAEIHDEPVGFSPSIDKGLSYYAPAYRKTIEDAYTRCVREGVGFDETLLIATAKGRYVWVRAIGEAVRDEAGRVRFVRGALQDVSELVEARKKSQQLAEQLYQTLDAINDGFVTLDTKWRFTFVNQEAMRLLEKSDTDLLGQSIWREFPDLVGTVFEEQYRRALDTNEVSNFVGYHTGLAKWFSVRAYPSLDGLALYFQDVTDTRAQQEQLALLEAAVSRANDVVLITEAAPLDLTGPRIVYVNEAFTRVTGYTREEAIGRTPRILQGRNTSRSELARIRAALERGDPVRGELINCAKDGREYWLELEISPIVDATGRPTHFVAVERDITERKAVQQALVMSEQRFRTVAKLSADIVWDWDLVANTIWRNEEGLARYYSPGEPVGQPESWMQRIHPEDRERVTSTLRVAIDGGAMGWFEEYRLKDNRGRYRQMVAQAAIIRDDDGQALRSVGSAVDVTEQRELEQQVRQSEERYRTLFEAAPYAVIVTDRETHRLIAVNEVAAKQYGRTRDEMLAMTISDFYLPEDLEDVAARRRQFSSDTTRFITGLRHVRKDGTLIDVEMAVRWIDYNGRPAAVAVITDVSERLKLQRAHAAAEEQLRASQKLEAVGKLTGGVAHDFNNILMVIMANVDAVLEEEDIDEQAKANVRNIGGAAERAAQLTRQLLAFSRKQTLRPQWTILNDLVTSTGALLRRTLGADIEINSLLAEDLWPTETDRAQVEAALINLCVNARDAMPDGGQLLIETKNVTLDADYVAHNPDATAGDYVMLSVTDTGSGMTDEVKRKAFEPFFTTKGVGKGTGLGLSMIYGFVKQSNGHVAIYSEVGRGTVVKLYLPRSRRAAVDQAQTPALEMPRGTERILLVEDEEQVRSVVARQLTSLGYIVTEASNGEAGLQLLNSGLSVDLLLTDVIMPGSLNGKDLATEGCKLHPELRVLFMSGYSEEAISTLGILNRGVTLLSKPFSKSDLALGVRQTLDAAT